MIIAHSPFYDTGGNGLAAYRVVLRETTKDYVICKQFFYSDGKTAFGNGHYFSKFYCKTETEKKVVSTTAWLRWLKVCEEQEYPLADNQCVTPKEVEQ